MHNDGKDKGAWEGELLDNVLYHLKRNDFHVGQNGLMILPCYGVIDCQRSRESSDISFSASLDEKPATRHYLV